MKKYNNYDFVKILCATILTQFNPAITWECFTEQFTHKCQDQVKQQLTKQSGYAVEACFLISDLHFAAISRRMKVMKASVKKTPSSGYRYTVNDGSGWKNGWVLVLRSSLYSVCFVSCVKNNSLALLGNLINWKSKVWMHLLIISFYILKWGIDKFVWLNLHLQILMSPLKQFPLGMRGLCPISPVRLTQ